jgi:hypothetical protein
MIKEKPDIAGDEVTEEFLRIPRFAKRLGCSEPKARLLVRERVVDSYRVDGLILVPASEVRRLLLDGYRPRRPSRVE